MSNHYHVALHIQREAGKSWSTWAALERWIMLFSGHDQFHSGKGDILATGLRCSSYIQADDTGARHQGKNSYATTSSKSRENFLSLLHRLFRTYALTENALDNLYFHA